MCLTSAPCTRVGDKGKDFALLGWVVGEGCGVKPRPSCDIPTCHFFVLPQTLLWERSCGVKAWLWRKGKGLFSTTFSCGEVVSPGLGCQYPQGLGPVLWHQFSQLLPCHVVVCAVFLFGGMVLKPPGDGFRFPPCPVCANAVSLASLPPTKSRIH